MRPTIPRPCSKPWWFEQTNTARYSSVGSIALFNRGLGNSPFLRKAFNTSDQHYAEAVQRIEEFLADVEERLSDGRKSILSGDKIDYVDISLAAISSLCLQAEGFGAGKADSVCMGLERVPPKMRADSERWISHYPSSVAFVNRLYGVER